MGSRTSVERLANGKPEAGTIRISASHEAARSDQCRRRWPRSGYSAHSTEIDCARPRQGGRSRAHEQWRFAALILAPGFSTAATSVSGRGRHGCGARKYRGDRRLHLALFHAWPRHLLFDQETLTCGRAKTMISRLHDECRRDRKRQRKSKP